MEEEDDASHPRARDRTPPDEGKLAGAKAQYQKDLSVMRSEGLNGKFTEAHQNGSDTTIPNQLKARIDQLPPEMAEIIDAFVPMPKILSRLAQTTNNNLKKTIADMSRMALPPVAANGNASHAMASDDNSPENVAKKLKMLKFAQDAHTDWTKALVMMNWSRRSEEVSKLIALRNHIEKRRGQYDYAIFELSETAGNLVHARLPNPDLKTATAILTTGKASWMPELGYIQPPPLTAKEILKSIDNVNTLLSIRLNLHEYDNIPVHFMDYTIGSGRVTFNVAGEFAVDLTIADEDPETQFWFIDFRFLFSPSLSQMPEQVRAHIDARVNEALMKDGLSGCYRFLHGMVLTHKISEFRRQAVELARGKWIDGLKVEALNRAVSFQYWLDRYRKGPKSWIILGVHSGKRKTGRSHPKDTSRLFLRWFRDSKEVKDVDIPFDTVDISAESLLKTVVAKHINHILTSTYERLRAKPMFASHEAVLSLFTSVTEPAESELRVQLTSDRYLTIRIEPITGRFILGPSSRLAAEFVYKLNENTHDPAANAHSVIEELRQRAVMDDIVVRGLSLGWSRVKNPGIKPDDLRSVVPKDTAQVLWLDRAGWVKNWHFAVSMSMNGDRWWLIETTDPPSDTGTAPAPRNQKRDASVKILSSLSIPIWNMSPNPTYGFLANLHVFAAALLSGFVNSKWLHSNRIHYKLRHNNNIPSSAKLPAIITRLSELLAALSRDKKSFDGKRLSLKDAVQLTFQGLETVTHAKPIASDPSPTPQQQLQIPVPGPQFPNPISPQIVKPFSEDVFAVMEARIIFSPAPPALERIKDSIDRDIAFHQNSGACSLRMRSKVGESIMPILVERVVRIARLVNFIHILQTQGSNVQCRTISLGRIAFTYGKASPISNGDVMHIDGDQSKEHTAQVDFSASDNTMTLVLERGNPHLEIIDHLTRILNGKEGLDGVAKLLPLTLPVLQGLDAIEMAWASVKNGEAYVNVRAADWYIIRYDISQPASNDASPLPKVQKVQKIMFEVRLRHRRGAPWWNIGRIVARDHQPDGIDAALKPVWDANGEGWLGMRVSGVAQAHGVEELLGKMDGAIRGYVGGEGASDAPATGAAPSQVAPAQPRPKSALPPPRQQPTPNHSQNSQVRNNQLKREVVEID